MKEILQKYSKDSVAMMNRTVEIITEKNKFIVKNGTNELICAYSYYDEMKTKVKHTYFYKEGTKYGEGHGQNITDKTIKFDYERIVPFNDLYEKFNYYQEVNRILTEIIERTNIVHCVSGEMSLHNYLQIYSYVNNEFIQDELNEYIISEINLSYLKADLDRFRIVTNTLIKIKRNLMIECFKVLAFSLKHSLSNPQYEQCMKEIKDFISDNRENKIISFMFDEIVNLPKINLHLADIEYKYDYDNDAGNAIYVCDLREFGIPKTHYLCKLKVSNSSNHFYAAEFETKYDYIDLNLLIDTVKNCTLSPIEF